ncbi:unnamed protein product [Miscanthus lutarioriparius]|uniref:DUF4220 domain-containing protein n=1 Tax=Miscanthus lutarioriparius TaxID=422564 RepID=A0A811NGE1_9POAL|nr:unnamed protein product [Miscanthus lutarioriparius]
MGRCRCFPVALRKLIGLEPEDDDNVVERPEELINRYVRLMTATANITSGLGALALLWSTVVLLGGFVAVLGMKDFWTLTLLSFLMACRVVDNYDKEFKRGIYTEEDKIMSFIRRQKWIHEATAMCQRIMLGMALLPKYILLTCLLLLSFNVAPYVSLGISVWRLVRRDYGDAGGDVANRAKLNAALDIFYALALLQSLFVLYWGTLQVMLESSVWEVTAVTRKQYGDEEWSLTLVDMYRSETIRKFRKDGELPGNWNFITYGVELLQSASGDDDHRWGARILDKLISGKDKSVRQELLSSRLSIQNLMGMIGRRRGAADGDMENRERATTIVAHLASDLHITSFPGTLQCICSLLESTSSCDCEPKSHACPSGNPDEQATLPTDENDHQHGSLETSEHQDDGTHMDMVAPTITDQTDEERQAVVVSSSSSRLAAKRKRKQIKKDFEDNPIIRRSQRLISQGLLILERLTQDQGNCTEISKDQSLLSRITSPLMRSASHGDFLTKLSDNTTVEMLSKSLTVLSRLLTGPGDDVTRLHQKLASNTEAVSNLMGILENDSEGAQKLHEQALEILTELAFDGSFKELDFNKLFKALLRIFLEKETNNITKQEPNNNATSQVEQADTERAPKLRGNAGEALARLLPVRAARGIISKQEAIDLLNKVLHKILSSKMGTTADAVEIVVENQPQEDADTDSVQPPIQENEKQSEERKFMAAMLSLAVGTLAEALETMSEVDDCMLFAGNECRLGLAAAVLYKCIHQALALAGLHHQHPSCDLYSWACTVVSAFCREPVASACAFPFVMALGNTNSMTAYSVDDNKQYMRHFIQQLLRVLSLFAMWRANETILTSSSFLVPLLYLFLAALLLSVNGGRIYASMTASSFLDKQSRYVQLHMKSEHTKSTNYNPVTLHGYKYPFYEDYNDHEDTIITLDRIWCSNEGPLGTSDGNS